MPNRGKIPPEVALSSCREVHARMVAAADRRSQFLGPLKKYTGREPHWRSIQGYLRSGYVVRLVEQGSRPGSDVWWVDRNAEFTIEWLERIRANRSREREAARQSRRFRSVG